MDLINIEFAKRLEDSKYHLDHRKVLCESKIIGDLFYRDLQLKSRYKRNIKPHCIQITSVEGQVVDVQLIDNGLYVASKLVSLRPPTSPLDLINARTILKRLWTLKVRQLYKIIFKSIFLIQIYQTRVMLII